MPKIDPKPSTTRESLIKTGLMLFGNAGFDATSTRQIAQAAGTNISAISYHFGGKEGLRTACAEYVSDLVMTTVISNLPPVKELSAADASAVLENILSGLTNLLLLEPQAKDLTQFMLREVTQSTELLDVIYPKFFEPAHKSICELWAQATGQDADSSEVILTLFSVVGQVVYFRIGQEIVRRRMGWENIGPNEVQAIQTIIRTNLHATLDVARKGLMQ